VGRVAPAARAGGKQKVERRHAIAHHLDVIPDLIFPQGAHDEQFVIGIVFDQKDEFAVHSFFGLGIVQETHQSRRQATRRALSPDRAGSGSGAACISTISNQYRPSDRVTLTSVSKVTGLTRYMSAPRLRARQKSSSALEAVNTTTGMSRSSGSALISARASRPSLRGMFRSSRMRPGRGASGALVYRPRRCR